MTVARATVRSIAYCVDGEKRLVLYASAHDTAAGTKQIT